jgi:pyruvate kinase
MSAGESLASGAVKTAIDIQAKLIVVMSQSGKMASYVSKYRPGVSAMMLTTDLTVARQSSGLLLGMHTIQVDSLEKWEELIEEVNYELLNSGMMEEGDKIVVIAGRMAGMQERLIISEVGKGKSHGHFVKGGGGFFNRGLLLRFGTY